MLPQSEKSSDTLDITNARAVAHRIATRVRRTPVLRTAGDAFGVPGRTLLFKLEYLQHAGSFKARGAFANLTAPGAGTDATVTTASGGNHGAAIAYAARALGRPAVVFVPGTAPQAKRRRIEQYGAQLHAVGTQYADALSACNEYAARTGARNVHAYDAPQTLLGQAGVGLELLDEPGTPPDVLLVAVGGGGLIGGVAMVCGPQMPIVSVEPERAPSLARALEAGSPVDVDVGGVAADSLGARRVGALMFPIAQRHVRDAVLVTDDAIVAAQRILWNELRILTEPGGATALAALISRRYVPAASVRTVGVVLCGANLDDAQPIITT